MPTPVKYGDTFRLKNLSGAKNLYLAPDISRPSGSGEVISYPLQPVALGVLPDASYLFP